MTARRACLFFFFFNDTATTEIYTLSLHDALPIWPGEKGMAERLMGLAGVDGCLAPETDFAGMAGLLERGALLLDRKSTRLNSSHQIISYAVFCLKKKTIHQTSKSFMSGRRTRIMI